MKKLFFLFALLASIAASATVTVTPLSVDYNTQKVTFSVAWNSAAYNNRVWVWIDLCPVPGGTPGAFQPAEISAASATGGSVLYASSNTRGFFVTASPATVTATLDNAAGKFNWCAYASDAPPEAEALPGGGYKLHGTPPFTINGTITENTKTFGAGTCITSITDLTGNPDGIAHDIPQATISGAAANPCPATTSVLTAAAANAATFTWYKNGAEVQSGTSTSYTVTATDSYTVQGSNANCTGTASTAKVVTISTCGFLSCAPPALVLTGVGFASTASYTRYGIIISSPVTVTTCQKTDYNGGSGGTYNADCRTNPGFAGHLFSGCMLQEHATQLCPSPWRVPTFDELSLFACGVIDINCHSSDMVWGKYGWEHVPAYTNAGVSASQTDWGVYWTNTPTAPTTLIVFLVNDHYNNRGSRSINDAVTMRCIKDL